VATANAEADDGNAGETVSALAFAEAGYGGTGRDGSDGTDGGDASASATAIAGGADQPVVVNPGSEATARGGGGGSSYDFGSAGNGGNAQSSSSGSAVGGAVTVRDYAVAGSGGGADQEGGDAGSGGHATSRATGENAGSTVVRVESFAQGGSGGLLRADGFLPGLPGSASASATGSSSGGGDVFVTATQVAGNGGGAYEGADGVHGADSIMRDAVAGSTAGLLSLTQLSRGGDGGSATGVDDQDQGGTAGSGGKAESSWTGTNPGGGSLDLMLEANGGAGGGASAGGLAGRGGAAEIGTASAAVLGDADVSVAARARGGEGGQSFFTPGGRSGDGGTPQLGVVRGASEGGSVAVLGEAIGGKGGDGQRGDGGDGAAAIADQAVEGSTAGALTLEQRAQGGRGGNADADSTSTGTPGSGGNAISRLIREAASASLVLISEALGGDGGDGEHNASGSGDGGAAEASGFARNSGGDTELRVLARGGGAGEATNGIRSGDGGAAAASAAAEIAGDGLALTVRSSAFGRSGGILDPYMSYSPTEEFLAGDGGDASSESSGVAAGNSSVEVNDYASAGRGGSAGSSGQEVASERGGDGGDASSTAFGANAGSADATVRVNAQAIGASGGRGSISGGRGGIGTATAHGESSGSSDVFVEAEQNSGHGGDGIIGTAGADSIMVNPVSGSTGGALALGMKAQAGWGGTGYGGPGGSAGNAYGSLVAENPGGGDLEMSLRVWAGSGGHGPYGTDLGADGGIATLGPVRGTSENGSAVRVFAYVAGGSGGSGGGRGADLELIDAIEAETTGDIALTQWASAGSSGETFSEHPHRGGDATSILSEEVNVPSLALETRTWAGNGGWLHGSDGVAARGGDACSESHAVNWGGPASAIALSEGGNGKSDVGDGPEDRRAISTAIAEATTQGEGHDVYAESDAAYAYTSISEATGTAERSGSVEVRASADASSAPEWTDTDRMGDPGGDASASALGQNSGGEPVDVEASAEAGDGGGASGSGNTGGEGGLALARGGGISNGGGDVTVLTWGEAGKGGPGWGEASGGRGGDAIVEVTGEATGPGQSVLLGAETGPRGPIHGAFGGDGGRAGADQASAQAGAGGDATSLSRGTALGSHEVIVRDHAAGGTGGILASPSSTFAMDDVVAEGGDGGSASSTALASSEGSASVGAFSEAVGGDASSLVFEWTVPEPPLKGNGGDASALADANGLGEVHAHARAVAGHGGIDALGGAAAATARAVGATGEAIAEASTAGGPFARIAARASSPVASPAEALAEARMEGPSLPAAGSPNASALVTGSPADFLASDVLSDDPRARWALEEMDAFTPLASMWLGAASGDDFSDLTLTMTSEVEISLDAMSVLDLDRVVLSSFGAEATGSSLSSIGFRVEADGTEVLSWMFNDVEAALLAFENLYLDLGSGADAPMDYAFLLDATFDGQAATFGTGLLLGIATIPEPSVALLVSVGVAMLAAARKRL